MVAFAEITEVYAHSPPRARGQDRRHILGDSLRGQPNESIEPRSTNYTGHAWLGSCSKDPIGYVGSKWNLYQYVISDPLKWVDPTGLIDPPPYYPGPFGPPIYPESWYPKAKPLTPDQVAAYAACAEISGSQCGGGCTQSKCEEAVEAFIAAVDDSWLIGIPFIGPIGTNTCERQANDILKRLPDIENNPCVAFAGLMVRPLDALGGLTTSHAWARMHLCNGTSINGDNGAFGGDDQIWVGNPGSNRD